MSEQWPKRHADVAAVTRVLANRARLAMLELLMDGRAHPAGDLAREAGVALSTASGHLSALARAGLVQAEPAGRQRRYRLSRPEVARAIEALAVIAPRRRVSSLAAATAAERLRQGRTCYDPRSGFVERPHTRGLGRKASGADSARPSSAARRNAGGKVIVRRMRAPHASPNMRSS